MIGKVVGRIVPPKITLTPEQRAERHRKWISQQLKGNPILNKLKKVAPQAPPEIIEERELDND